MSQERYADELTQLLERSLLTSGAVEPLAPAETT